MTRSMKTRKKFFQIALTAAGMSQEQWRKTVYQVSRVHLNECFSGRRVMGAELSAAIDAFIAKHYPGRVR